MRRDDGDDRAAGGAPAWDLRAATASRQARRQCAWGADWLPFLLAAALALTVLLPVLFDVIREIPPSYDCGEAAPVGLEQMATSYRNGFEVLHALAAAFLLAAIAALSVARRHREGASGIGKPTGWALVGLGVVAVGALVSSSLLGYAAALTAVPPALALLLAAAPLGPQLTGLIAAATIALLGAGATLASRTGGSLRETSVLCWALLILTAGHALIVSQQGHGPYFC